VNTAGAEQFLVSVSVASRHGRTKLHTFASASDAERRWRIATPASAKQYPSSSRLSPPPRALPDRDTRRELRRQAHEEGRQWQPPAPPPPPPNSLGYDYGELLGAKRVDLGAGVTPQGVTLAVILDALRSGQRTEVDLGDLNKVLSQIGSRITQLDALPDEQRRHAQTALFSEVLRRCTSL